MGVGSGMVLGTVALIRQEAGIPLAPEIPPSIAKRRATRRETEASEIILVAEEFLHALALVKSIKWAEVVGIVAEGSAPDTPLAGIKVVSGVSSLMERVEEDTLLLLDATNGVVLLDPDPIEIAQYQAEYERIAPRQRIFLEEQHLPARTLDGKVVPVVAEVTYAEEIEVALNAGADALLLARPEPLGGGFFVPDADALLPAAYPLPELRPRLLRIAELAAGKPLFVPDDYTLASPALLEAASFSDMTLLLSPRADLAGWGLMEYREVLPDYEAECVAQDRPYTTPQIGVMLDTLPEDAVEALMERFATSGATRVSLNFSALENIEEHLEILERLCLACSHVGLPVIAELHYDPEHEESDVLLRSFLGAGVGSVRVVAEQVQATKRAIRAVNVSVCRELVGKYLQGETA
jgi:hypothetical protein